MAKFFVLFLSSLVALLIREQADYFAYCILLVCVCIGLPQLCIGTASANSVKLLGIKPLMYIEDLL